MQYNHILKKKLILYKPICDPWGGAIFGAMGNVLNLVDVHYI